jgi:hypoxanthine phosphoribosyltransferase
LGLLEAEACHGWQDPVGIAGQEDDVLRMTTLGDGLDDILDEGVTLASIAEYCLAAGAAEVLMAVLVDKRHDRKVKPGYRADFTGLEVEDRFLFGYGLDYKGFWRNAPGIYAVKGL